MGYVFSAFGWSYVLGQLPGGWLLDRFGSKTVYFWSIFIWSAFTMLQGGISFITATASTTCLKRKRTATMVLVVIDGAGEQPLTLPLARRTLLKQQTPGPCPDRLVVTRSGGL